MTRATLAAALFTLVAGCRQPEPLAIGISVNPEGVAAARLAAAEINAAGGIDGRPLALHEAADGRATQAQPAIAAADAFVHDRSVLAVVGHGNSSASLAAAQIYNAAHLPQIAPTTTAARYTQAGPFSFRLVPSEQGQAVVLARRALAAGRSARLAVFYVNDDYGRGLHAGLDSELQRLGLDVVYEAPYLETVSPNQVDGPLAAVSRASPDLLFWLGRLPELLPMLAPLRAALPRLTILGSDGVEAAPIYTDPRCRGIGFVRFVDLEAADAGLVRFRQQLWQQRGYALTGSAVLTYDAVKLVTAALRDGARSREAVRAYLATVGRSRPPFRGLSGAIAFDEQGDVTRPYQLVTIGRDRVEAGGWQ
ncbi:MAG TPA: ABC transporter substrate-binding protein [Thermoanaerobaculia bacterium]|nr:ABC transporter substrate-binding protein [Thermoanaerobaculia bacterium]